MCGVRGEAQLKTVVLQTQRQVKAISHHEDIPLSFKKKLDTTKYS
jgi:hypothetical protein